MPQRSSPRSAEQVARKSRPRSSSKRCMSPRTSATKPPSARLISPMEPISSSTRSSTLLQFTSQVSTLASS